jgi:hypothetical protein
MKIVSDIMRKYWNGNTQDRDAVACAQWEAGLEEPVLEKIRTHDNFTNFPWCNLHEHIVKADEEYKIIHCTRPDHQDWLESYAGHVLSLSPAKQEDGYMWYPAVRSWEPIVTPAQTIARHVARDNYIRNLYNGDPNYKEFSFWNGDNINEISSFVDKKLPNYNHSVHENINRLKNCGNDQWLDDNIKSCLKVAEHIGTKDEATRMIDIVVKRYL